MVKLHCREFCFFLFHLFIFIVGFECWESNAGIVDYMKNQNISTYAKLEEKYIQRIVDMVDDLEKRSVVWQEVFENGVQLAPATIVHVWTGDR